MNVVHKHNSLRSKFITYFCLFLVTVMISGASYLTSRQNVILSDFVKKKGEGLLHIISEMSGPVFDEHDRARLDNLAASVLRDREVVYLFFVDENGNMLNTLSGAINIGPQDYRSWGIIPDNPSGTIRNLLQRDGIDHFEATLSELNGKGRILLGLSLDALTAASNRSMAIMAVITILVIVVTALMSYYIFTRFVSEPLRQIVDVSTRIAEGDLQARCETTGRNEIGLVSESVNTIADRLRAVIAHISALLEQLDRSSMEAEEKAGLITGNINRQNNDIQTIFTTIENNVMAMKEIASQTDELKSYSEETSSSILELAATSGEIAGNMDILTSELDNIMSSFQQITSSLNSLVEVVDIISDATEETSASVSEIKMAIREIEELSDAARKLVDSVKGNTETRGLPSIEETIDGMKKIKDSVEVTAEIITILNSKSQEIDKILQVIDDVTDRTTLLSLNAAILAAQAGEQGKSFSVVAGEIKKLAEDTSASTKEIGEIISMIQKEIKTAVQSMGEGVEKVAEGMALAEEAGKIFRDISSSTKKVMEYSERIYSATSEQFRGVDMVARAVHSVNERMEGLLSFAKDQKQNMDVILSSVEKIRDIAHQVKSSTDEQKKASNEITSSAENVSNMSASIAIAISVLSRKSDELLGILEEIRKGTGTNMEATTDMTGTINSLREKALDLKETIDIFKI